MKQEEIKKGTARLLFNLGQKPYNIDAWGKLPLPIRGIYLSHAGEFLKYLHSQGVVIEVDRELPEPIYAGCLDIPENIKEIYIQGKIDYQQDMLKAGYVAVEPLVQSEPLIKEE